MKLEIFLSLLLAYPILAVDASQEYTCNKISKPLKIDGKMDDAGWKLAPWTQFFVDIEGAAKPKPRFRTWAKMLWDEEYFYIAAELEEPSLWATYDKHDMVIFHEHDFEVFLDPDGDGLHYFEFEMNAKNTGWDLYLPKPYKDGGKADDGWEIPGLKTAVHLRGTLNHPKDKDRGWSLEIAIPWSALNRGPRPAVAPKDGEQWRVNFSRVEWVLDVVNGKYEKRKGLKEDNWVWSPQGVINMHVPEKWGVVKFVR
ncbi:MAG: carbohydrate-binding family 9-like protein [Acidobacteria bacterium]|nr:carbohydrate-binding family 9-like protein [Acidobacteriota bacterium]